MSRRTLRSEGGVLCIAVILFVMLFMLKVTGDVEMDWVWVTSPLWGLVVMLFGGALAGFLLILWIEWRS